MTKQKNKKGFSLAEVLIAVGVLAVGMSLVAGVFPVAINLATISTERTIAAEVADEAFAKIKLIADSQSINLSAPDFDQAVFQLQNDTGLLIQSAPFRYVVNYKLDPDPAPPTMRMNPAEFAYPSDVNNPGLLNEKQYFWSAICSRVSGNSRLIEVTVFVSRRTNPNLQYRDFDPDPASPPQPVIDRPVAYHQLVTQLTPDRIGYAAGIFTDGAVIVDDQTGQIFRLTEFNSADDPADASYTLDKRSLRAAGSDYSVWLIPPSFSGGSSPCIGVFQKQMRF